MAAKESKPLVESSSVPGIFYNPLSTFIPGTIPLSINKSTNYFPSSVFQVTVSENNMTPEMCFSISGAVNNIYLYLLLFSSLFSTSMETNFFPRVPSDSSAAKIPFPAVQIFLAVSEKNQLKLLKKSVPPVKVFQLPMNPKELLEKNSSPLMLKTLLKTEENTDKLYSLPLKLKNTSPVLSSTLKP